MNLRKDHYRLLTLVCSIRLTPSGIDLPHGLFLLGVSACLPVLATFLLDGLISCQLSEPGWPAIAEVPYPFPSLVVGVVGCSKRFKELPPQPGFVISPLLGCAANLCFARLSVSYGEATSGRKSENPKHNTIQWIIWLGGR